VRGSLTLQEQPVSLVETGLVATSTSLLYDQRSIGARRAKLEET